MSHSWLLRSRGGQIEWVDRNDGQPCDLCDGPCRAPTQPGAGVTLTQAVSDPALLWTSDRRLYLTADKGRVVADGDPEAAFLLVAAGGTLPTSEARQYGLLPAEGNA